MKVVSYHSRTCCSVILNDSFEICLHYILSTDVLYTVWTVHVCCIGLYVRDNMSR